VFMVWDEHDSLSYTWYEGGMLKQIGVLNRGKIGCIMYYMS